jgi:aminotransferase
VSDLDLSSPPGANRRLSRRAADVLQSEIRNMSVECARVGGINLSQGVCDTPLPSPIADAVAEGVARGYNIYTRHDGITELREAIAAKQHAFYGVTVDPDTQVIVSGGATGALYSACLALLDAGDEVVLFEPYYGYHLNTLRSMGVVPSFVPMYPPDWTFSGADLERVITPRTRAIVVNTPGNPSGKVYTRPELELIRDVAVRHDLIVLTDEIYEHFLFDGRPHVSPATIPGMADRTITISGFSKTFSITGWRLGYAIAPDAWAQTIGFYSDLVYVCAPAPLQYAVARGMAQLDRGYYDGLSEEYARKRAMICEALERAGLTPFVPQGAYYVIADASRLPGRDSKDRAMYLLQKTGVASVPGEAFFQRREGANYLRFCFAKNDEVLAEACERLASKF